jgi:hypothetical protein
MDIYLITGTHFAHPSQVRRLCAHPLRAAEAAVDLVNCLRAALDPVALPPITSASWIDALAETQRHRLATLGIPIDDVAGAELPKLADFDVWMEIHSLDIATERKASPLPLDETERDAILAALRLLQARGCPAELLDIATNGDRHAIASDEAIDALCERLNIDARHTLPRIVVAIEGGLVSGVVGDRPISLLTIDYDVEGADEDEISEIPQDDGRTASAVFGHWSDCGITRDPTWIDTVFAALDREQEV